MARIDDAVRRILRVKVKAGLFADKRPLEGKYELLGAPEHRAVAREAVRKSLVLLKNDGVLPMKSSAPRAGGRRRGRRHRQGRPAAGP
jgi:beta-glucosidase